LDSHVKHKLFSSYCNDFFGWELWALSNEAINDICIAWRKGSRRVWELPYNTHCSLIPLLGNCLPLLDEICGRSLNFISSCFAHESNLIRFVAIPARFAFFEVIRFLGILFSMERYEYSLQDIITGNCNHVVKQYFNSSIKYDQLLTASFLSEPFVTDDSTFLMVSFFRLRTVWHYNLCLHLVILLHFICTIL
jgi:hypothetical protein